MTAPAISKPAAPKFVGGVDDQHDGRADVVATGEVVDASDDGCAYEEDEARHGEHAGHHVAEHASPEDRAWAAHPCRPRRLGRPRKRRPDSVGGCSNGQAETRPSAAGPTAPFDRGPTRTEAATAAGYRSRSVPRSVSPGRLAAGKPVVRSSVCRNRSAQSLARLVDNDEQRRGDDRADDRAGEAGDSYALAAAAPCGLPKVPTRWKTTPSTINGMPNSVRKDRINKARMPSTRPGDGLAVARARPLVQIGSGSGRNGLELAGVRRTEPIWVERLLLGRRRRGPRVAAAARMMVPTSRAAMAWMVPTTLPAVARSRSLSAAQSRFCLGCS